jgi:nucleoid DNA-binding protein
MLPEDKPVTLSVKDFLIKKMAVKMRISESVIEAVIEHQFKEMMKAMEDSNSVELSGFGKFIFNEKKATHLKGHIERALVNRPLRIKDKFRQTEEQLKEDLIFLNKKLNGN